MRNSNYRKKLQINRKFWYVAGGAIAAALVAAVIFFFVYFRVENVEVMGSSHYTDEEVREMILRGPMASNSVLAPLLYSQDEVEDVLFVEGFSVTQLNRNTIAISVKEKQPVGCIPYLDSYIYFDRTGVFIEGSRQRDESVPYFDGIQVNRVVMGEKLPIKGDTVLNTAVALATIFQKNQMIPDHIQFDNNYQISLLYGDITVMLGKDRYLEDKMTRVIAILPMIEGKKGILHVESVTDSVKTITFEEEIEEITAENWPGGMTRVIAILPMIEGKKGILHVESVTDSVKTITFEEEIEEITAENWPGGYDEELDYTGAGEYDANGNYVGPAPTQEELDANGDWKGGYEDDGSYTKTGEYDREGNYVGPNPNEEDFQEYGGEEEYGDYEDDGYEDDSSGYEGSGEENWDEY